MENKTLIDGITLLANGCRSDKKSPKDSAYDDMLFALRKIHCASVSGDINRVKDAMNLYGIYAIQKGTFHED